MARFTGAALAVAVTVVGVFSPVAAGAATLKKLSDHVYCDPASDALGFVVKAGGAKKFVRYTPATLKKAIAALPAGDAGARKRALFTLLSRTYAADLARCRSLPAGGVGTPAGGSPPGEFGGRPGSLAPYKGKLTGREIRHLLGKVAFGGTAELEAIGRQKGLGALVDALVDGVSDDAARRREDEAAGYWAGRFFHYYKDDPAYEGKRVWTTYSAAHAHFYRAAFSRDPFKVFMTSVLASHFAVNLSRVGMSYDKFSSRGIELYSSRLRRHAVGDFAALTGELLTDPAMGRWLNNLDNHKGRPNQNFARELLELFLLGRKDPVTGAEPYDERTIAGATAAVSGYRESKERDPETGLDAVAVAYDPALHDAAPYKVFHAVAETERNFTPPEFVAYVLGKHPTAPRYIADRLAGQLLYPGLPPALVKELASVLRASNYQLKPFLKAVLRSEAMFSKRSAGSCVTSPFEHAAKLLRIVGPADLARSPQEEETKSASIFWTIWEDLGRAGQKHFEPPSVFGWKGACNVNRAGGVSRGESWTEPNRMLGRQKLCGDIVNAMNWMKVDLKKSFGITNAMSELAVVRKIAARLGLPSLGKKETAALVALSKTYIDDNTKAKTEHPLKLEDEWRWRKKIPRIVCLLAERPEFNER